MATPATAAPPVVDPRSDRWEDQGLYVTLAFNAIVFGALIIAAFTAHQMPHLRRILRPNRPGSRTATFFLAPNALFEVPEYEVLEALGVRPMVYILILKYFAFMFIGMCLTSIMIVSLCATDNYLNVYRYEEDPDQCNQLDEPECKDTVKCFYWPTGNVTIEGRSARCQPAIRRGLFDFAVQNITPRDSWRLLLFALACILCCLPIFYVTRRVVVVLYRVIRTSYVMPIFNGVQYGGLATVGARTVLIGGLPKDAVALTKPSRFLEYLCAEKDRKKEILKDKIPQDYWFQRLLKRARKRHAKRQRAASGAVGEEEEAHGSNEPIDDVPVPPRMSATLRTGSTFRLTKSMRLAATQRGVNLAELHLDESDDDDAGTDSSDSDSVDTVTYGADVDQYLRSIEQEDLEEGLGNLDDENVFPSSPDEDDAEANAGNEEHDHSGDDGGGSPNSGRAPTRAETETSGETAKSSAGAPAAATAAGSENDGPPLPSYRDDGPTPTRSPDSGADAGGQEAAPPPDPRLLPVPIPMPAPEEKHHMTSEAVEATQFVDTGGVIMAAEAHERKRAADETAAAARIEGDTKTKPEQSESATSATVPAPAAASMPAPAAVSVPPPAVTVAPASASNLALSSIKVDIISSTATSTTSASPDHDDEAPLAAGKDGVSSPQRRRLGSEEPVRHLDAYLAATRREDESTKKKLIYAFPDKPRPPVINSRSGLSLKERCAPLGPPGTLTAPSWDLARDHAISKSLVIIREAPTRLIDLIEDEADALEKLTDAYAAEQFEEDPEKKPVKKRLFTKLWRKVNAVEHESQRLEKLRKKIEEKLPTRGTQDMTGAAVISFDRPSSAYAFVRQYNEEAGTFSDSRAMIAGPRANIVWSNLGETRKEEKSRFAFMILVFTVMVFVWGIPVAILGNVDRLDTIPSIGPAIATVIYTLPPFLASTLAAILPALLITLFNLLLPPVLRIFSKMGGVKTKEFSHRRVLLMCGIFSIMSGIVMQAALQGGFIQAIQLFVQPTRRSVQELVISIVSPSGGYWYAYLISAACVGNVLGLFVLWPLIVSLTAGNLEKGRQEEYDRYFVPRENDYPYLAGRHLFFGAIGMFFHGTVAFLQPFAVIYSVLAYLVERSVLIDGAQPDVTTRLNYAFALTLVHAVMALHTVASVGNLIVCALRESIGAPILVSVALICSVLMHIYVHRKLAPVVYPTPEMIASLEHEMDNLMLPREQIEDTEPYVPDFATYRIDYKAVNKIKTTVFNRADKTWPTENMKLHDDPPATFLCFGTAAVKQQQLDSLSNRVHTLESENDRLRDFYLEAHRRANRRRALGSIAGEPSCVRTPDAVAVDMCDEGRGGWSVDPDETPGRRGRHTMFQSPNASMSFLPPAAAAPYDPLAPPRSAVRRATVRTPSEHDEDDSYKGTPHHERHE
jgi:hypothetical protein